MYHIYIDILTRLEKLTSAIRETRASRYNGAPLKPLDTIVLWCSRGFRGARNWAPMMPRNPSVWTPDGYSFYSLVPSRQCNVLPCKSLFIYLFYVPTMVQKLPHQVIANSNAINTLHFEAIYLSDRFQNNKNHPQMMSNFTVCSFHVSPNLSAIKICSRFSLFSKNNICIYF